MGNVFLISLWFVLHEIIRIYMVLTINTMIETILLLPSVVPYIYV